MKQNVSGDRTMRKVEINTAADEYEKGRHFILDILVENGITKTMISETMLIYEALYYNLTEVTSDRNMAITIAGRKNLGDIHITIGYAGKMVDPMDDTGEEFAPEVSILRAYADKLDYSYRSGYNTITITVRRSYSKTLLRSLICGLAAALLFIPVNILAGPETQETLIYDVFLPLERLFSNAILMIGAPVTFLSLIKHFTDVYIVSGRDSGVRQLQRITIATSCTSMLLAAVTGTAEASLIGKTVLDGTITRVDYGAAGDVISSIVPPSIFEPFVSISPIPIIVLASLFTYALCSVGKYFDTLKNATDAMYVLCARILSIVMIPLPFFCFAAVMDMLLRFGFAVVIPFLLIIAAVLGSLIVFALFYVIRLKAAGISPMPFVKKLKPLLIENWRIDSAIDAEPYNVRFCARAFGLNRKDLERDISVLSQINLDGSCFLLTVVTIILVIMSGMQPSVVTIVGIVLLILFLSFGAPSQPGSCIIGLVIIFTFLRSETLLPIAICVEVLFGGVINIVNVFGDIMTAVIMAKRRSKASE